MIFLSKALNSFLDKNLTRIYMLDFIMFPNNPYHVFLVKEINVKRNYFIFQDAHGKIYRNSITALSEKLSLLNEQLISNYLIYHSYIFIKNNIKYIREDYRKSIGDRLNEIFM